MRLEKSIESMKYLFLNIIVLLLAVTSTFANSPLFEKLQQIREVSNIQKMEISPYVEYYEFWFEQPIDHDHPEKGSFKQRVLLGHRETQAPVVAVLEGYGIHTANPSELSELFKTNQVTIEHRFFNQSKPAGTTPWEYLTLKQAATDQHRIIQSLKKALYPKSKWISTGISKGGQTTIYHRYFYPNDVDISVPYVAPMNLEAIDSRLERFLSELGNEPRRGVLLEGKGKEDKYQIFDFQKKCFEHLDKLVPRMETLAKSRNYTFTKVGGIERATKLVILEFPFSFWQWGGDITQMPLEESANWDAMFSYLVRISSPDFFDDAAIEKIQAFYYAALTETGMYAYNIKPFKKYFKEESKGTITFRYALPKGYEQVTFNTKQLQDMNRWLQTDADKMLFIYGGQDPWSATAVDLKKNQKCARYIKADANHTCRIKSFEHLTRTAIIKTLSGWLLGVEPEEAPDTFIY